MTIKILRNAKIDIDYVDNPEGLPFVDFIIRNQNNGHIIGWHSFNKEQLEEVIKQCQRILLKL